MLSMLASATDEDLTTLKNVKEVLDIYDTKHDEYLTRLITRSSRRISSYLGRPIGLTKYQALLPAFGGVNLQLPRYPIRDVFRVFDGSDTGLDLALTSTEYRLDKDRGWLNRDEGWKWTRQIEGKSIVPGAIVVPRGEWKRYLVEFTAGYVLSGGLDTASALWSTAGGSTSTGETLLAELEDAAIELTRTTYLGRFREPGVISEKVGDVSIRYDDSRIDGLPKTVVDILSPLRSVI